ncbi:MAG: DNA-3-methyladenine glycosylase [Lachnospiraceae bacterium]|nr:DNA-3-methyladenine glycosylase [Lachnospiraceae bacterium]
MGINGRNIQGLFLSENQKRLTREFFLTDALELSRRLIGKIMVHETPLGEVRGIITETEAYMGVEDKGSHTYGGRRTERTEPMFHIGGTSYVYFIYGMYNCVNVTAGVDGIPMASLIRMVEPADEASRSIMERFRIEDMQRRRAAREKRKAESAGDSGKSAAVVEKIPASLKKHLADGPGKLCIAMHITKADNDIDMAESRKFYLTEGIEVEESRILTGKRIGIDYAEEAADYLWRFTLI